MLPELLEQDHRKQTGVGPAPGDYMERRRSLADLLAVPAGELLADMLNHLPLARRHLLMLDMLGNWPIREAFQMAERRSSEDVELGEKTIGQEARLMNKMLAIAVAFFLVASPTIAFAQGGGAGGGGAGGASGGAAGASG